MDTRKSRPEINATKMPCTGKKVNFFY